MPTYFTEVKPHSNLCVMWWDRGGRANISSCVEVTHKTARISAVDEVISVHYQSLRLGHSKIARLHVFGRFRVFDIPLRLQNNILAYRIMFI